MNIWRSESFKNKHYTVELLEDSLYDWHVRLLLPSIDADSPLHADLKEYFAKTGKEGVLLHIQFKDSYPIEPPMVRVVDPVIRSKSLLFASST
jgi:ubiquitin-conjugating enzyme E2 Q